MSETCQRCGEEGEDRRTLWMACLYEMNELNIPFEEFTLIGTTLEKVKEAGFKKTKDPTVIDSRLLKGSPQKLLTSAVGN